MLSYSPYVQLTKSKTGIARILQLLGRLRNYC